MFARGVCVFVMCVTKVSFFLIDTGLVRLFISNKHTAREEGATRNDQHMQACANISGLSPSSFLVWIFSFSFSFSFSLTQRPCPQLRKLSIQALAWDE
jgi:hypothetical protein